MSNLLQMPHRCAEAMWEERELRAQYRKEVEREKTAAIKGIGLGFMWGMVIWGCIWSVVWAVRLASRYL